MSRLEAHILACCLVALLVPALLSAQAGFHSSAFESTLHSRVRHSLLNENPNLYEHDFADLEEGLRHPFKSWSCLGNNLKEAFGTGHSESSLLSYRHGDFAGDFNFLAGYEANFKDQEDYGFLYKGWRINACYSEALRLESYWYNGAFYGGLDAAETDFLIDGYYKRFDNHIQLDNHSGELGYYTDDLDLAIGRGRYQMGNSITGSIVLSDQVNDYAYLKAEGRIGVFRLSLLHGSLMADSTYSVYDNIYIDSKNYPEKYIALHQLSFFPGENTELFAGETVIYGNRGIDLNYLLPHVFWRAVEHDLWDRDNVLVYGGINQNLPGGALLYAQMALDEFSYGKFFSSWWGNKYALQGGISMPAGPSQLSLEATAVRPFTYTHFMNHTMYSHDGRPLGFPQGSNVLDISFEANIPYRDLLRLDSQISWRKRGSRGSSWQDNYHDIFAGQMDEATAYWFEGEKSHEYQIRSSIYIPVMAHHDFLIGHDSLKQDDWEHRLFAAWQFSF